LGGLPVLSAGSLYQRWGPCQRKDLAISTQQQEKERAVWDQGPFFSFGGKKRWGTEGKTKLLGGQPVWGGGEVSNGDEQSKLGYRLRWWNKVEPRLGREGGGRARTVTRWMIMRKPLGKYEKLP